MTNQDLLNYGLQIGVAIFSAGCIYTTFRYTFKHHERILDQHEKRFEKHEKAIDKILDRLDHMSEDVNFIKGCMFGKQL